LALGVTALNERRLKSVGGKQERRTRWKLRKKQEFEVPLWKRLEQSRELVSKGNIWKGVLMEKERS